MEPDLTVCGQPIGGSAVEDFLTADQGFPLGNFPLRLDQRGSLEELDVVVGGGVKEGGRSDNATDDTVASACCEGKRVLEGRDRQLQVVSTSSDATSFGI